MPCDGRTGRRSTTGLGGRATTRPHPAHLDCLKEVVSSTPRHPTICGSVPDSGHAGMTTRRLAAILAVDVVGYSRLMGVSAFDDDGRSHPCGSRVYRSCI